ncbi:MAG: DUF4153 domain-containing protein [Rhodobacteraceae bacterium]|nr:DUF4153 domain-containing protein [Paracoccaceae bacterium]
MAGDYPGGRAPRVLMAALGAVAGWALWWLDAADLAPRLHLGGFFGVAALAGTLLALIGPLRIAVALPAAAGIAGVATALLIWASFRFDGPGLGDAAGALAGIAGIGTALATPLAAGRLRGQPGYATAFDITWDILVRGAAGGVFIGAFWATLAASDALLGLVGIDLIDRILALDGLAMTLSGAVGGLGLAVAHEMQAQIAPHLILRLLRLLVPPVLLVVVVFLIALAVRGLGAVFGDLSAAVTLMAMAGLCLFLIACALDRDDAAAVQVPAMRLAVRGLVLMLPVMTGLAAWAVALRVAQYGWSPARVIAAVLAALMLGYGLAYGIAALRRGGWMARIRRANPRLALAAVAAAVLLLTPVVNPQAIAARDQLARHADSPGRLPLWELQHEWGRAGQAVMGRLRARGDDPVLLARLAALDAAQTRFGFENAEERAVATGLIPRLRATVPVRPEGAVLPLRAFEGLAPYQLTELAEGCEAGRADAPGCVILLARFLPGVADDAQGVLAYRQGGGAVLRHFVLRDGQMAALGGWTDTASGSWAEIPASAVDDILNGRHRIAASGVNALVLGERRFVPGPK